MEKTPEGFIEAMEVALKKGDFYTAQGLSIEAGKHYPDHAEVQRYAYILAPAKITTSPSDPERRKTIQANREWIKQNRDKYRNRWVAVRSGELLADASSLDELADKLDDRNNVLFTVLY